MPQTVTGLEALQPASHGSWEPRRALTLNAARRRTAFVRFARLALSAAAAGIIVLLAVQLFLGSSPDTSNAPEALGEDVRMINPTFYGRDENLTPYSVTADTAIRRNGNEQTTDLVQPRLNYDFLNAPNADSSSVLAQTGLYDAASQVLDLRIGVNLETESGYTFQSEHARIFLREEQVVGDETVDGIGPMGTIRANRFEIRDGGNHIIFSGRVRARLIQDRTAQTALTSANEEE